MDQYVLQQPITNERYVYLDNLRGLLMTLGVVLHACAAFSPSKYWIVSYPQSLPWVDTINAAIHLFRMPLFFIISGFFAVLLLQRWPMKKFVKAKIMRVGLPLAVVLVFLNIPQSHLIYQFENVLNIQVQHHNVVGHLWFLVNLLVYFIGFACLYNMHVKLPFLQSLLRLSIAYPLIVLSLLFLLFPSIHIIVLMINKFGFDIYSPVPIIQSVYLLLSYLEFFLLGAALKWLGHHVVLQQMKTLKGFLLFGLFITLGAVSNNVDFNNVDSLQVEILSIFAYRWQVLSVCLITLAGALFLLNSDAKFLKNLSSASYTIYLVHHFVVILLVVGFTHLNIIGFTIATEWVFVAIIALSLLLCLSLHFIAVNRNPTCGLLLNGKVTSKKIAKTH